MTQKENVDHSCGKKVIKMDSEGKIAGTYSSINDATRSFNFKVGKYARSSIAKCCKGNGRKTAYGYYWKFK